MNLLLTHIDLCLDIWQLILLSLLKQEKRAVVDHTEVFIPLMTIKNLLNLILGVNINSSYLKNLLEPDIWKSFMVSIFVYTFAEPSFIPLCAFLTVLLLKFSYLKKLIVRALHDLVRRLRWFSFAIFYYCEMELSGCMGSRWHS